MITDEHEWGIATGHVNCMQCGMAGYRRRHSKGLGPVLGITKYTCQNGSMAPLNIKSMDARLNEKQPAQ